MGEKEFCYLIERAESNFVWRLVVWRLWVVLTNSWGEAIFQDVIIKESTGPRSYRSRIID